MTWEEAFKQWSSDKDVNSTLIQPDIDVETAQAIFRAGYEFKQPTESIPYKDIIADANEILGKNFRPTELYKSLINARWKEGFRREDFAKVCQIKHDDWDSNPDMRPYLRLETLFSNKFCGYLNSEPKKKRQIDPDWL